MSSIESGVDPGSDFPLKFTVRIPRFLKGCSLSNGTGYTGRIWKGEDQGTGSIVVDRTNLMFVVAMDVAVEHRDVVVGRQDVHHVITIAGEPFPVGPEIEQGTVCEHHDRRALREASDVFLKPLKLFRTDFRLGASNVVQSDEVNATMIE